MFCKNCDNLLERVRESNKTIFKCNNCNIPYEMKPEYSMVYQSSSLKEDSFFSNGLRFAGQDLANKKIALNCTDCKSAYARLVRVKSGQLFNVCTGCDKSSIYEEN